MSLSFVKPTLQSDIEAAYIKTKDAGAQDGAAPKDITHQLAVDLHAACERFMKEAVVTTKISVPAGQPDSSPGATTSPGEGDGEGTLSYSSSGTIVSDIETAYNDAKAAGEENGADPASIISILANGISKAIHNWAELAVVNTAGKIKHSPPRMNALGGIYAGPHGTSTGVGTIFFPGKHVDNLYSGIKTAFENVKTAGEKDGADPGVIIEDLSWELADAIYLFAVEAEVDTDVTLPGKDSVVGSIVAGAPVPGVSAPWNGTGEGRHPNTGLS